MAKLPKKLKVAAFDIVVEPLTPVTSLAKNQQGLFNALLQRIEIMTPSIDGLNQLDTVLHEVFHAIYWAYNIEDRDDEERTVATLATGLTQVLRDNPQVLKYINETLKEI